MVQRLVHGVFWNHYERWTLNCADRIVCVSQYTAKSIKPLAEGHRVNVISNAIDTEFFSPPADQSSREDESPFRMLFVGNLIRRKGADLLPDIMLSLGSNFELRFTSGLRSTTDFSHVPNMVPLGRLTEQELREEYRTADALLFPTRFEGFGYAAAEALSCGTPVIASRCSALPEVVIDNETGLLVDVNDVQGFTAAARKLSEHKALRDAMAAKGRAYAEKYFTMDRWAEEWSKLLNGL
jgi:glycosyltransferase involved in cell wall biosynthesis